MNPIREMTKLKGNIHRAAMTEGVGTETVIETEIAIGIETAIETRVKAGSDELVSRSDYLVTSC
jgi:hypothetical protein